MFANKIMNIIPPNKLKKITYIDLDLLPSWVEDWVAYLADI